MGNKRKYAYRDPNEDEYIFNCLVNYPTWAKEKLTPQELAIFKSENSIRQFVGNATADQKKLMLAKANIRSITMYLDMNKDEPLNLQDIKTLYNAKQRKKVIDDIQQSNAFAISSREMLSAAYLIAQNCHTPYYYANQNFKRVYNAVEELRMRGLKNYTGGSEVQEMKALESFRDVCANFYLASMSSENFVRITQRLDMIDVRILLYLFLHRDTYVEKKVIHKLLFAYKANSISSKLTKLLRDGYVDIHATGGRGNNGSYTIAELGIIAVSEILEKLAQQAITI